MPGILSIDLGDYYTSGDRIDLDLEPESGYVTFTVDTEGTRKDLALTSTQARALAAGLVHLAGEVERR